MARLEDLIKDIADPRLRAQIAGEVAKLKAKKKFGLVFEEHLPEVMELPGLAVKPGARVVKRGDKAAGFFLVKAAVNGKKVRVVSERGGPAEIAAKDDLVVVKRFGEPMYPALIPVDRVTRAPGKPYHTLINADNFHALQVLLYCYQREVDVIYIDPPYNSGARDWKYNNNYVDRTDQYRHSKWLSMMQRRLELAKRLLKPDGVLIVTIDENEIGHLSVLLETIFPEYLRHMVATVINPKGTGKLNFARVDEYIFFCVPNNGASLIKGIPTSAGITGAPGEGALFYPSSAPQPLLEVMSAEEDDSDDAEEDDGPETDDTDVADITDEELPFPPEEIGDWELRHARRRGSESSYRHQRKNQFYPIYIDVGERRVVRTGTALPLEGKPNFAKVGGLLPIWPIDKDGNERCWRFIPPKMQTLIDAKRVRLGQYNPTYDSWTLNIWERRPESKKLKTVWWKKAHDAGTHGTTLLHNILGRRATFPFPKSIYAVADALAAVVRTRPNALIVDFFAGSGTTLHSTCMLNAVYGGFRRCVLVTNNEVAANLAVRLKKEGTEPGSAEYEKQGICAAVTWPRVEAILLGRRRDKTRLPGQYLDGRAMSLGFEENAQYLKLDFLDPGEVKRGESYEAILPILWMMAGASGDFQLSKGSGKHHFPKGCPFCVLLREDHFKEFAAKLAERPDITHVFLVTDSVEAFHEMGSRIGKDKRCVQLYKSYLDNFKINLEPKRAD
ncbi:MAG: DNA methyltransferase [Candidatus Sumerlaeota bacterium]|nr:DNA methyltransferase [Candidatus Sumerlaeota bacterium]